MSERTVLASIETRLGNIDLARGVAYVTLLSRYTVYRTVTRTNYRTITHTVVSEIVTAITRTYNISYGNIQTSIVTILPTNYIRTTYTVTAMPPAQQGGGGGGFEKPVAVFM